MPPILPPPQGGLPPEIAALLAGRGGAGPAGPPPGPGGPPAGLPPAPALPPLPPGLMGAAGGPPALGGATAGPPSDSGPSRPGRPDTEAEAGAIQQGLDLFHKALLQEKDPQDRAEIADLIARAHKILGNRAKEEDAAIGVSPAMRVVRRATGGGA